MDSNRTKSSNMEGSAHDFISTLANGYQELTDAAEQRRRFEYENAQREIRGEPVYKMDKHLLAALTHGMPECSGVALGVDRLLMAICGAESLDEVVAFPFSRA